MFMQNVTPGYNMGTTKSYKIRKKSDNYGQNRNKKSVKTHFRVKLKCWNVAVNGLYSNTLNI